MKKFIVTILTLISIQVVAETADKGLVLEKAQLAIRLTGYTSKNINDLPETIDSEIKLFNTLPLNPKTDMELTRNLVKLLLIMDTFGSEFRDPSRSQVKKVVDSYNKHKDIFHKAMQQVETPKNKKQLEDFRAILQGREAY